MDFPWIFHGISMDFPWFSSGFPMENPWVFCVQPNPPRSPSVLRRADGLHGLRQAEDGQKGTRSWQLLIVHS